MTPAEPSVLDRTTGPALISWPVLTALTLWSAVLITLAAGQTVTGSPVLRAAAGILGGLAAFAVLVVGWWLAVRPLHGLWRGVVAVLLCIVAGVVRGMAVQSVLTAMGLSTVSVSNLVLRTVSGAVTIPAAILLVALATASVRDYRVQVHLLSIEQQRLAQMLASTAEVTQERRREALERVRAQLTAELADIPQDSAPAALSAVEGIVGDVVRPLSHTLASEFPAWTPTDKPVVVPPVRIIDVLREPQLRYAIRPGWLLVVLVALPTPAEILHFGLVGGTVIIATGAAVVYPLLLLARWIARRVAPRSWLAAWLLLIGLLFMTAIPTALVTILLEVRIGGAPFTAGSAMVTIPLFGLVVAVISMMAARMRENREALEHVTRSLRWHLARARAVQWQQRGALSRALHGPVQSLMHAAVFRMRRQIDDGSITPEYIDQLRGELAQDLGSALSPRETDTDVRITLTELTDTWVDICDVTWTIEPEADAALQGDALCADLVCELSREAVSNSVRHGQATMASIRLSHNEDDLIALHVRDDGTLHSSDRPGLGTTVLSHCTFAWERFSADGTELHAQLPVQAHPSTARDHAADDQRPTQYCTP